MEGSQGAGGWELNSSLGLGLCTENKPAPLSGFSMAGPRGIQALQSLPPRLHPAHPRPVPCWQVKQGACRKFQARS